MIFTELPYDQQDPGISPYERGLRMEQVHGTERRSALDLLAAWPTRGRLSCTTRTSTAIPA